MNSKTFSLVVLTFLFVVPFASASTITRSIPKDSVYPGELVPVTLDISVTGGEKYYLIDEKVPAGWTVTNPGSGDSTDTGHVKWAIIQNAASTEYTYQTTAPQAEGSYSFSGTYMFQGMTTEDTIEGQQIITVSAATFKPGYETLIAPVIILGSLIISVVVYKTRFWKFGKKHDK